MSGKVAHVMSSDKQQNVSTKIQCSDRMIADNLSLCCTEGINGFYLDQDEEKLLQYAWETTIDYMKIDWQKDSSQLTEI